MPGKTDLYRYYCEEGQLLYVGISISAIVRMAQHRVASHWYNQAKTITISSFDDRQSALEAERKAIKEENPLHNIQHKSEEEKDESPVPTDKHGSLDKRNTLKRTVSYKPLYTTREIADVLYGETHKTKHVKNLIEAGQMQGILVKEREQNTSAGIRVIREYVVTGWQLIEYIEALEAGEARWQT